MLYKFYKYIYYRIYSWNLKQWGKSDVPEYNAMLGIALLTFINIISILTIIEAMTAYEIFSFLEVSTSILFISSLSFIALHYFVFFHKGKYKKIIKEFETETKEHHKKGTVWVLLYIIGSVVILFGSWFVIYLRNT